MTFELLPLVAPLLMPDWLDPYKIIASAGGWAVPVVALIVFAECGLFSILPGDSLLFAVGMLCAMGVKGESAPVIHYFASKPGTLVMVELILFVAAVLGNIAGYWLGRLIGPPLFKERKGFWGKVFDPKYVAKTHDFFDKYGPRALILARFVPLVRTFVTLIAGVGHMNFRKFLGYTAVGGALWVAIITTAGYFLGNIPFIQKNIEYVLVAIVVVSLVPMLIEYLNGRRQKARDAKLDAAELD